MDANSFYEPLTGVGWYLHQILVHLADRDDLRLRLYGQSLVETDPGAPKPVVDFPTGPAIERVTYAAPDGLVVPPWRADQILRRLAPLLMAADGNAVLFAPNYLFPPLFRFAAGERVATIHDLGVIKVPWAVRPDSGVALRERLERTLFAADLLLTPSEAVRRELIDARRRSRPRTGDPPRHRRPVQGRASNPAGGGPGALRAPRRHDRAAEERRGSARGLAADAGSGNRAAAAGALRRLWLERRGDPHGDRRGRAGRVGRPSRLCDRRRAGRLVRGGRAGGAPVLLRGVRPAGDRGAGRRGAAGGERPARSARGGRGRRPLRARPTGRISGRRGSARCWRTPLCAPSSAGRVWSAPGSSTGAGRGGDGACVRRQIAPLFLPFSSVRPCLRARPACPSVVFALR